MARRSHRSRDYDDAVGRLGTITRSMGAGALIVRAVSGLYLNKALPGQQASIQSQSTSSSSSGQVGATLIGTHADAETGPVVSGAS